jgi:class 3 adenylate cyclase
VIAEEHDIFGDGVNVAARLEALAEPGGVCVSRMVRDNVRDKLDYAFEDLGEQWVKNQRRSEAAIARRRHRERHLVGGKGCSRRQRRSSSVCLMPVPARPA